MTPRHSYSSDSRSSPKSRAHGVTRFQAIFFAQGSNTDRVRKLCLSTEPVQRLVL
jgi:hypothetical protein